MSIWHTKSADTCPPLKSLSCLPQPYLFPFNVISVKTQSPLSVDGCGINYWKVASITETNAFPWKLLTVNSPQQMVGFYAFPILPG